MLGFFLVINAVQVFRVCKPRGFSLSERRLNISTDVMVLFPEAKLNTTLSFLDD